MGKKGVESMIEEIKGKLSGNVMTRLQSRTLTDWKIWIFITGSLRLS